MKRLLEEDEVWRMMQLLFMLYRDLVECTDQIEYEVIDNPDIPEALSIIEINERFTSYQKRSPSLPFEDGLDLHLSVENIRNLHYTLMKNKSISTALDLVEALPDIPFVTAYIQQAMTSIKAIPTCVEYLKFINSFVQDLRAWLTISFNHAGSSLEAAIKNHRDSAYLIFDSYFSDNFSTEQSQINNPSSARMAKISHLFKKNIDLSIISGIYQSITEIRSKNEEGSVTLIAAIIAEAYDRNYLKKDYRNTLQTIFDHLEIQESAKHYRPAKFTKATVKGTIPESHEKALAIFRGLDAVHQEN